MTGVGQETKLNVYELARYPFIPAAEEYLRSTGFTLEEATTEPVLGRVKQRIELAIKRKKVDLDLSDIDREIISFYISLLVIKSIADGWLINAFARAEGERSKEAFINETSEAVSRIINQLMGIRLKTVSTLPFSLNETEKLKIEFSAPLVDYLKVNSELGQVDNPKLALVNNYLYRGTIYLTRDRVLDMVRDQFSLMIKRRISDTQVPSKLPARLQALVDEIKKQLPKPRVIDKAKRFEYIERILESKVQDGRHRILWLILPPYLVNVKHLSDDEAIDILKAYVQKIGWKEARAERIIRYNVRRARRIGLMPPTLERLKRTHQDLYNIIVQSIGVKEDKLAS